MSREPPAVRTARAKWRTPAIVRPAPAVRQCALSGGVNRSAEISAYAQLGE